MITREQVEAALEGPIRIGDIVTNFDAMVDAVMALIATPAPQAAPSGYVLVPLIPNREMQHVMDEEGWQWEDLLAAAEAITEEQYNEIAAAPASLTPAPQGTASEPKIPQTPEEIVAFIGAHYDSMEESEKPEETWFQLSVHDLQSAMFYWFQDVILGVASLTQAATSAQSLATKGAGVVTKAATSEPVACEHDFHYFGDQPARRCNKCNAVEVAAPPAAQQAPSVDWRAIEPHIPQNIMKVCGCKIPVWTGPQIDNIVAALSAQQAGAPRDREQDRLTYPDPDFNAWLDKPCGGETVWHTLLDTAPYWVGWKNGRAAQQAGVQEDAAEEERREAWKNGYSVAFEAAKALFAQAGVQEAPRDGKLHGFDREDLEAIADGLESGYEKSVDVGGSPLDGGGPNLIASTTACAAKFIRAALSSQGVQEAAPVAQQSEPVAYLVKWKDGIYPAGSPMNDWSPTMSLSDIAPENLQHVDVRPLVYAGSAPASTGPCSDDTAKDAARYRWLRAQPFNTWKKIGWNTWNDDPAVFPHRDEYIDAALSAAEQGGKHG